MSLRAASLRSIASSTVLAVAASTLTGCTEPELEPTTTTAADDLTLTATPELTVLAPTPWVARHGMTAAEYQAEFDQWVGQGYRLTDVSGYNVNGTVRYAALWEKKAGPEWVARHGMSSADYQSYYNTYVGQGYRLTLVDGYESGGQARYAAIWEKTTGPALVARHGLTSAQYQAQYDQWVGQGYRLSLVEGYGVGGTDYYAAIWEKTTGPALVARHGMTAATYQSNFDTFVGQGYRLTHVSAYQLAGADRYAAIWEKVSGGASVARHRLTARDYQHAVIDRQLQGYRLKDIDGYALSLADRYAAIWEAEPTSVTGDYCRNGQCFELGVLAAELEDAIDPTMAKWGFEVRRGRTVIQRADGPGRTAADLPMTDFGVHDRFNPASVSKSITSVALLQLLDAKGISIDTPIWTYLPSHWAIPANNKTITFAEILNHTSGLRNDDADGGYKYANMETLMEHQIALADKVYEYANVNTALARVLVASLDGYTAWLANPDGSAARFITYVNREIFAPLGIYDVAYKATGDAPTLFYPNPPGTANGTAYGDWSLQPGSAGAHVSLHELTVFAAATFKGLLLPSSKIAEIKTHELGFADYGAYADGTKCYGKGGYFPGSWNGGAELSTVLIYCDNGVAAAVMVNGEMSAGARFKAAMTAAFAPQ